MPFLQRRGHLPLVVVVVLGEASRGRDTEESEKL
jgi:hypothetical protein